MVWKKLKPGIEMWNKPCLGNINPKNGERFMALCVDPSSFKPYRGLARQVIDREGSEDVPGYTDKSILVIVESDDLLTWKLVGNLKIKNIEKTIASLGSEDKEFLGLEDPDIFIDNKGIKHVYFTIPFMKKTDSVDDVDKYDVFIGHAQGESLEKLTATGAVLGKINKEIRGFKEICPIYGLSTKGYTFLTETFVALSNIKHFSAIGLATAKKLSGKWKFERLVHSPEKENKEWCAGHSSPCRIIPQENFSLGNFLVGIMNGRETTIVVNGKKNYRKFRPGLFVYDPKICEILWIDSQPLFEDPIATTITFASELVPFDKDHCLIYAHPNDSFIRVYKVAYNAIRARIPKKF